LKLSGLKLGRASTAAIALLGLAWELSVNNEISPLSSVINLVGFKENSKTFFLLQIQQAETALWCFSGREFRI